MNIAIGFLMTQLEEFVNCLNHAKVSVLSFAPNVFLENQVVNRGFAVLQEYVRYVKYGNTGCGVFKRGVQNQKDFCIRIDIPKGNYQILSFGLMAACQK